MSNLSQRVPYPTGNTSNVMSVEKFIENSGKGMFTNYDTEAFWGDDKGYDPTMSAWVVPQPVDSTKVVIMLIEQPHERTQ